MPKRDAWSRLMVILSCGALARRSLDDVGEFRQRLHLVEHLLDHSVSSSMFGILQRVLELPARDAAADGDVLRRLQEQVRALDLGELRPQAVDDLRGGRGRARRAA